MSAAAQPSAATQTPDATEAALADALPGALDALALESLEWAWERSWRFRLPADVTDPGSDLNWTMKPLGELAQLTVSIRRCSAPDGALHRSATRLLEFCWDQTGEGRVLLELFHAEPHTTYPLEIYAAFAGEGLRHAGFEDFARARCATRSWSQAEQQPHRRLGILNAERRAGITPHGPFAPALRRTWLGGLPEPWTFEQGSGYHLTHTVFHVTDWGAEPSRMPADLAGYLLNWLPSWTDTCLDAEQWDLACELLAVGASLPVPLAPRHTAPAWQRLAGARGPDGALPEDGDPFPADHPDAFALSYHSTLGAAFAATLTAARLRERGADPDAARSGTESRTDSGPGPRPGGQTDGHTDRHTDTDGAGRRREERV
ncbi:DUF6895 family protein [Streptomyces sp. SM14]|uniref:DUF6895 family protein n=1 Tax=Streptomyces sp. SM14 TaxID=1736045 RepID=UPI000CD58262|nr:hypothetical protein [Streptomyces sp. SM14]